MSHFDQVTEKWGDLKFMDEGRANFMRDLITAEDSKDLLEIGFWRGKSSAYFAAILEDLNRGHLTTVDRKRPKPLVPGITEVLESLGLTHRVTPVIAHRSHTWIMSNWIAKTPVPQFDFIYFDGGHTWDDTALGVTLCSMLLKQGGILVLDDLFWSINSTISRTPSNAKYYKGYSKNEMKGKPVMRTWQTLVPYLGFGDLRIEKELRWGIARKISNPYVSS